MKSVFDTSVAAAAVHHSAAPVTNAAAPPPAAIHCVVVGPLLVIAGAACTTVDGAAVSAFAGGAFPDRDGALPGATSGALAVAARKRSISPAIRRFSASSFAASRAPPAARWRAASWRGRRVPPRPAPPPPRGAHAGSRASPAPGRRPSPLASPRAASPGLAAPCFAPRRRSRTCGIARAGSALGPSRRSPASSGLRSARPGNHAGQWRRRVQTRRSLRHTACA